MEDLKKTTIESLPAILIDKIYIKSKKLLCKSKWFEPFKELDWGGDGYLNLSIENENVKIFATENYETHLIFQSIDLRDKVYDWIVDNDVESPKYWKKIAQPIKEKLESDNIELIKEGIIDLKNWVKGYEKEHVDNSMNSADLSVFGYDYENWEEGDLWPNPLFDTILEKYKEELSQEDLLNLIEALHNKNEEFADTEAVYTAINYLLENRTPEIELLIVNKISEALKWHEPGHRFYELSLLDRLIDEIFPTFSVQPIIELLENAHEDNLRSEEGDDFVSLAYVALDKSPDEEQAEILKEFIEEYGDQDSN